MSLHEHLSPVSHSHVLTQGRHHILNHRINSGLVLRIRISVKNCQFQKGFPQNFGQMILNFRGKKKKKEHAKKKKLEKELLV